ncbi:MAG: diacylglycerol/polyprenol kinase family protein [Cyanobium sp.]
MPGPELPSWWLQQGRGVAVVALWLGALATGALLIRHRWPEAAEWSRKLVHIGGGAVVPLAWSLGIDRWVALPAAAMITLLATLNHRLRLLAAIEDVGRRSYGTVAYGASITLLLGLFWPWRADAVCAGVLVMAVGDGLAGLVGPQLASASWQVLGERRSLAGTLTMALASLMSLQAVAAAAGSSAPAPLLLLAIALGATGLEQIALLGLDNLTVPLAVALAWTWLS